MNKVIDLGSVRKARRKSKSEGLTLCRSGFHKWKTDVQRQFDVKEGRLVTVERCEHCGKFRTRLT